MPLEAALAMVRWPGKITPGAVSHFQWAFWDACGACFVLMPSPAPLSMDAWSSSPMLTCLGRRLA